MSPGAAVASELNRPFDYPRAKTSGAVVGEPRTGAWTFSRDEAIRTALKEMRRGGVDTDRAPKEALDLVIAANVPEEDHPALRERGR